MSVTVHVLGRPAPKGSRTQGRTKSGRSYTYPASKYETPWINAVRDATRNAMRHHEQESPPYQVDLTFMLARPLRTRRDSSWPTAHDVDKLTRAVLDGLVKGGAMTDDRHVVELHARKEYAEREDEIGVVAYVARLTIAASAV